MPRFPASRACEFSTARFPNPFGRNNLNAFGLVYTHIFSPVFSHNLKVGYGRQYGVPQAALAGFLKCSPPFSR